jgi:hypothetical protein
MAKSRKECIDFAVSIVEGMLPGTPNAELTRQRFEAMSDEEFRETMIKFQKGEDILYLIAPNGAKVKLNTQRNIELGKKIGHDFFQRVWFTNPDGSKYLSNDKYMIVRLPLRIQSQLISKKISIAKHNNTIDDLTGQPTGDSALGLDNTLIELMKLRGGDRGAFNSMNTLITRNGEVSIKSVLPYSTGVKSTDTLYTYLTSMHLQNTLTTKH